MKKIILVLLGIIAFSNCYSQEIYFVTGGNFTKYTFKSSNGPMNTQLQSGTGSNYEMGYKMPLNASFSYSLGLSLNEYNAVAGSLTNSYKWNTKYIGFQNTMAFTLFAKNNFQFNANAGLNLSGILYGKQELNGAIYDLKNQDEFSGLVLIPFAGVQARYKCKEYGYLSLGYSLSKSINPFNSTEEKLSFTTNQLLFGLHFNIK